MTSTAPDPIAILLEEHEQAEQGFVVFEAALTAATQAEDPTPLLDAARTLLGFLDTALEIHIRKEEEPLFPRLKARMPPDDRYVDELVAEHDQIRIRREEIRKEIEELLSGDDHDEMRNERESLRAAVAVAEREGPAAVDLAAIRTTGRILLRTLRVHFQSEEELAFPLATQLLSPEELTAAGWEMLAIDEDELTMTNQPYNPRPAEAQQAREATVLDLVAELTKLRQDPAFLQGDRSAATLIKQPDLRIVLTAMKAGAHLAEHHAPGGLTIHTLQGRLRVELDGREVEISAGQFISLPQHTRHAVTAAEESAFLLTIAWPADRAAE